jgi:hypothetical protein
MEDDATPQIMRDQANINGSGSLHMSKNHNASGPGLNA